MGVTNLECTECGEAATGDAAGWLALRVEDPDDRDAIPEVAIYCPSCAEREFGD